MEDFAGGLGPVWGSVVIGEIGHAGALQFGDAFEDAAADTLLGDFGEEPPGGREGACRPMTTSAMGTKTTLLAALSMLDGKVISGLSCRVIANTSSAVSQADRPLGSVAESVKNSSAGSGEAAAAGTGRGSHPCGGRSWSCPTRRRSAARADPGPGRGRRLLPPAGKGPEFARLFRGLLPNRVRLAIDGQDGGRGG